jgi:DNA-binding transcriptional ArsR family regulator
MPRRTGPPSPEERKARMDRLRAARAAEKAREVRAADLAKAIAHPARIGILTAIGGGTRNCMEIAEGVPLAQSTTSQHLKILRKAGLLTSDSFGPSTRYALSGRGIGELRGLLESFFGEWARAADRYERSVYR